MSGLTSFLDVHYLSNVYNYSSVTFYNSEQTQCVDNVKLGPDNHMILTWIDFLNT